MSIRVWLVLVTSLLLPGAAVLAADEVRVDCDFPGGNIVVDGIDADVVRLRPDLRDTAGWWFYWYFRVRDAGDRTLRFEFTNGRPVGVRGPAVSRDGGRTWRWLGASHGDTRSFSYHFAPDDEEVRFAFTIAYLQADWERFLAAHKDNRSLRPDVLCKSRHGRRVECLYVGTPDGEPPHRVLLTARHHACESMASFALEGLLQTVLAGDTEEGRWLAENVEFLVVPFVDKDGVEEGDQGKNRRPRDHNRDYSGESIYPETAALRDLVPKWSDGKLHVTMDLHCPWIRGKHNEEIYIVGSSDQRIWAEQQRLGNILESVRQGPLPYRAEDNLPFGTAWNQGNNYKQGTSFSRWTSQLPSVRLAASFELPYANARGAEVNPDSARAFGRDLACALSRYLRSRAQGVIHQP
jgi:hypothetical protein